MLSRNKVLFHSVLAFFLFLNSCKLLIAQNPRDSFATRKLPRALELIANQKREFTPELNKRIKARLARENSKELIQVGVIDSGLDLTHPDLVDQLAYRMTNGQVTGVGKDIMGADTLPSFMMIDPTLFAYGAEKVKKGLIYGEPSSPLQFMLKVNDRFAELLVEGIRNSPELSGSLFKNFNPNLFTIYGFEEWIKGVEKSSALEKYKKNLAEDRIWTSKTVDPAKIVGEEGLKAFKAPWTFEPRTNLPTVASMLAYVEFYDLFVELVKKTYEEVDGELQVKKHRQQLKEYMATHAASVQVKAASDSESALDDKVNETLKKAGTFLKLGYDAYNPFYDLKKLVRDMSQRPDLPLLEQLALAKAKIKEGFENLEVNPKLTEDQKKKVVTAKESAGSLYEMMDYLYKYETDPAVKASFDSKNRRLMVRTLHPYIDATSLSNSHHTHVAATIAKQDPNIRIYPIKVTTQSVAAPEQYLELAAELETEFKQWLTDPLIKELVVQVGNEYNKSGISDRKLVQEMRNYIKDNPLNLIFIDEVLKAIQEAGQAKLLLANVSLGAMFKKNHNSAEAWSSIATDIYSEFVRYKMGKTIQEHAPGTLFLVANGNDGAWVDGVSKSVFPVGITSERLIKIAAEKKLPDSPNNRIKNVVGVGSVNPNQETLTGFSNFLLDSRIPQIFSTGEEIMAAVPGRQAEVHKAELEAALKEELTAMKEVDAVKFDLMRDFNNPKSTEGADFLSKLSQGMTKAVESLARTLMLFNPITRVKMSGTSMATPTATGILAKFINKKRIASGLTADQLYNHPEFTPQRIIEDIYKIAKVKPLSGSIKLHLLVEGIEKWTADQNVSKIKKIGKSFTQKFLKKNRSAAPAIGGQCLSFY